TTGISAIRIRKFNSNESNLITENRMIATSITTIRKLVPQRGCCRGCGRAFSTVNGKPASHVKTVLCSAPWYSKTRRMSFKNEKLTIMIKKNVMRIRPSIRLNATEGRTGCRYSRTVDHAFLYQASSTGSAAGVATVDAGAAVLVAAAGVVAHPAPIKSAFVSNNGAATKRSTLKIS